MSPVNSWLYEIIGISSANQRLFLQTNSQPWIEYNCVEITTLDLSHKAWTSSITHTMLPSKKTHTVGLLSDLEGVIKPH